MICGWKEQFIPLKTTCFRAQSFSISKTRINKTRLPSCLCPKLYYTDDKRHTVIKVIENTRICPLYRSTEGSRVLFAPTQWNVKKKILPYFYPFLAHLSHWDMVSYYDHWMPVFRRALCVLRRPLSTISSKDISLTTVWILIKLGRNDPYMGLFKNCPNGSSPLHI